MLSSPEQMKLRFKALTSVQPFHPERMVACMIAFYATENGLKSLYMHRNKLKDSDSRSVGKRHARSFSHRIDDLIAELRIPASKIKSFPQQIFDASGAAIGIDSVHLAWRYGFPLQPSSDIAVEECIQSVIVYLSE